MPFTWTRRPVAWAAAIVPVMSMVAAMSAVRNIGSSWFDGLQSASNDERGNRHGDRAPRLSLLNCFERPGAHLAAAQIAVDQHTARRAVRVRQGEGRRLCVVGEQALAAPEHDGINQKPKLVDQPGCEQLAHHIPATPRQQVGAVLVFERAYRVCKVALERMAVLPGKRIGSVRSDVLGHAVEPISDEVAAGIRPFTRPIRREYLVGTTPQQQLERLRVQVLQGLADDLFGNDELAHRLLQIRPWESSRTGNDCNHCDQSASFPNGSSNETLRNRQGEARVLGCEARGRVHGPPRPAPAEPCPTGSGSSTIGHPLSQGRRVSTTWVAAAVGTWVVHS